MDVRSRMEKLNVSPDPRLEPAPERTAFDYSVSVAKAGALVFPFLGAGVTLFDLIITPLRTKRLSDWLEQLRLITNDLCQKVATLTPARLAEDEAFNTAFSQAAQAVLRTRQKEKLDALRNAVVNVALGQEANADRQTQFLALVDRFTAAHLILLRFFQDPAGHFERRHIPVPTVRIGINLLAYELVRAALPELHEQLQSEVKERTASAFQTLQVLFDDLTSAQLIALQRIKGGEAWIVPRFATQPTPYPVNPIVTHLGADFLAFISEPRQAVEPPTDPGCQP
jgi:hypothetical protein